MRLPNRERKLKKLGVIGRGGSSKVSERGREKERATEKGGEKIDFF